MPLCFFVIIQRFKGSPQLKISVPLLTGYSILWLIFIHSNEQQLKIKRENASKWVIGSFISITRWYFSALPFKTRDDKRRSKKEEGVILRACLLMALCGDKWLAAIYKRGGKLCQLSEHVFFFFLLHAKINKDASLAYVLWIKGNREGAPICMMY